MSPAKKYPARRRIKPATPPQVIDQVSGGLQYARTLWMQKRFPDALQQFERVAREEVTNVRAAVDTARAYFAMFQFERAEFHLERLQQIAPHHPGVYHLAGETYQRLKWLPQAIACFERAASLPGVRPETWIELASLYERTHQMEAADELVDRSLSVRPEMPEALLLKARLARRSHQYPQAESQLRSVIDQAAPNSDLAAQAFAELANLYELLEEPAAALDAIAKSKEILRSRSFRDRNESERSVNRFVDLIQDFRAEHLPSWRYQVRELPPRNVALLTGFPRSGTTLLEQVLDAHPGVISSEERDFLAGELFPSWQRDRPQATALIDVLQQLSTSALQAGRARYMWVMEYMLGEPIGKRLHVDKNPHYNLAIPVMLRLFPEARFLIALRDPRDVVLSCYMTYLPLNPVSVRFLTLKEAAERYAIDMRAWLKLRPMLPHWHEIRYEDLINDLPGTARGIIDHLDLPWDAQVLEYRQRLAGKRVTSPTYQDVAQPLYRRSVGRWQRYRDQLEPIMDTLKPFLREFGYE